MSARQKRQLPALLSQLKSDLKAAGHGIRSIAQALDVGETSVKRWLAGDGLSADRLEDLCLLAGTSLSELAERACRPPADLSEQLTLAQEQALTEDAFLSFIFFHILGGGAPEDAIVDFGIPRRAVEEKLERLERLALIDRLPSGRTRALIHRQAAWRRGPMRAHFDRHLKRQFVEMDYISADAMYTSNTFKLSPVGLSRLDELMEYVRLELLALVEEDRPNSRLSGKWYTSLFAAREMDTSPLRNIARPRTT